MNTSTLIDVIITSDTSKIESTFVTNNSLSDHCLIGVIRKQHTEKFRSRNVFVRNFKNYNKDEFKNDLRSVNWEIMFTTNTFNVA